MVSERQRTKPRASEAAAALLRPSSAATSGRRPGPSPPRPQTPPSAAPPGRSGRAPRVPATGGRGGADARARRPLRGRRESRSHSPPDARQELRTVPATLPPRRRGAPPAALPAPSPRWGLGGGRAGRPGPRRRRHASCTRLRAGSPFGRTPRALPAEEDTRSGNPDKKPSHSAEVPKPPVPQHPSGKSRTPLQEARIKTKAP
ncbi:putative uncharacterized protein encoded by LINC01465 [Neovison vison]|uniref:putative uncharacterized protein encoded by LINC01465 n=1 Tax=Neovison vison TaxID=452646 RepID=UPI001CF03569|nr:putative uncharacterized protein encoded by LINC01465 [Neogale vison]